jgi:pimeloyl-ACP methyl ester carboxylesterase
MPVTYIFYEELKMSNGVTIVFLHGAGTGTWVWERVMNELSTPTVALDNYGRIKGATPDNCAEAIVAELDRMGIGSVILVMHSLAGVLASRLSERLGSRVKRCLFIAAVIPPLGGSFVDASGFMNRLVLRILFKLNPKGLKPSPTMIRNAYCNDLNPQDTENVISRYTAEMPGLYLTPSGSFSPVSNSTYIKLLKDQSVPPLQQDSMIVRLDKPNVREIDAGHLVMLSNPVALANLIKEDVEIAQHSM